MWTTSKRKEKEKKEESLKALHYHHNYENIYVWIGGGEGVAQALLAVQSTRTYHNHSLMDFVYYYQLHWMTVNLLERIWVYWAKKKRTDLITPSNSRQSCSNKGIRSIHREKR
jgi:hypothetical protein